MHSFFCRNVSSVAVNEFETETNEKFWNGSKFTAQMSVIVLSYQLLTLHISMSVIWITCLLGQVLLLFLLILAVKGLFKSLTIHTLNFSKQSDLFIACSHAFKNMISYSACVFNWMNFCEIQSGAVQPKTRPYLTQRRLYKGIMGNEAAKNVSHKSCFFSSEGCSRTWFPSAS